MAACAGDAAAVRREPVRPMDRRRRPELDRLGTPAWAGVSCAASGNLCCSADGTQTDSTHVLRARHSHNGMGCAEDDACCAQRPGHCRPRLTPWAGRPGLCGPPCQARRRLPHPARRGNSPGFATRRSGVIAMHCSWLSWRRTRKRGCARCPRSGCCAGYGFRTSVWCRPRLATSAGRTDLATVVC